MWVIERKPTSAVYACKYCGKVFTGGSQKIRVHLTHIREGMVRVLPCPCPDPRAQEALLPRVRRETKPRRPKPTPQVRA